MSDDFFCSAPCQFRSFNPFDVGQPPGHAAFRRHGFLIQKIAGLKKDAERSLFACLYWIPTYMHHGMVNLALTSNSGTRNLAKPSSLNLHRASQLVNSEKRRAIEGLL